MRTAHHVGAYRPIGNPTNTNTKERHEPDTFSGRERAGARDYELRLQGHLDARWAARLEAASLVNELDGTSTVLVSVPDQAALHGLLHKVRDLGLPLISVTPSEPDRADHAPKIRRQRYDSFKLAT